MSRGLKSKKKPPRQPCLDDDGGPLVQVKPLVHVTVSEDDFCIRAVSKVLVGNEGGGGVADGSHRRPYPNSHDLMAGLGRSLWPRALHSNRADRPER